MARRSALGQVTIEGKSTAWKFPIDGAKPVTYRTCASAGGTFHSCPVCGLTPVSASIGAFADRTFPPPMISGFEEYRHPWAMNVAALPMPGRHHN